MDCVIWMREGFMSRLFGTDGIRGVANRELSCELAMKVGAAGAAVLTNEVHNPRILVAADSRRSGDMLIAALSAGICSVGGDVIHAGILPTPAMAYLVRTYDADAAVMISASHNSMEYNGIKWFDSQGVKLSDTLEAEIEAIIENDAQLARPIGAQIGHIVVAKRAAEQYKAFLYSFADGRFDGFTVVLDCANGAASMIAKDVFERLGATVYTRAVEPDGLNINDHCGSTHPEGLQDLVTVVGADLGFAFDGDADRLIAADECGNVVDGDRLMGINAMDMKALGKLKNNTLVLTVMSNLGLRRKMAEAGILVAETKVGDRYVLEYMLQHGCNLGGEQSGHIIFSDDNTTGDGILSAIHTLNVLKSSGKRMSQLAGEIPIYPQVLVNVLVDNAIKSVAMADAELTLRIREVEERLGANGRILVRASGTEPLIRIMLEGMDMESIDQEAVYVADVLKQKYKGMIKT